MENTPIKMASKKEVKVRGYTTAYQRHLYYKLLRVGSYILPSKSETERVEQALVFVLKGENYVKQGSRMIKCDEERTYMVGMQMKKFPDKAVKRTKEYDGYPVIFVLNEGLAGIRKRVRKSFGMEAKTKSVTLMESGFFVQNYIEENSPGKAYFQPYVKKHK